MSQGSGPEGASRTLKFMVPKPLSLFSGLFTVDFVLDLSGAAGSGGPAESVFYVQFLSKILPRVRGRGPNLVHDLEVGACGESRRAVGHGSELHAADGERHQI